MNELIDRLLKARDELVRRPVDQILAALQRVTARWLDHADPIRREAEEVLAESTGLAPLMLRQGLDQMLGRLRGIPELLDHDLGSRAALDGFIRRGHLRSRAWGPGLLVCIFSGNIPGIAAFDMALALALKSACLARPAQEEPHFAALFARSVAEVDELLGRSLATVRWAYEERLPLERAGIVLAYGSDQSINAIGRQVPSGVRFIGHGHKIGLAVVAREAANAGSARLLALDVAMYDQQGCVSPHAAYVERGGELAPAEFARALAAELGRLQQLMPQSPLSLAEAAALRSVRDEAEFTADAFYASRDDLAWAVVHSEKPSFAPSPLNRLLRTFAVDDIAAVAEPIAPFAGFLQSVAFAGPEERGERLASLLGHLGASRICPVGRVQQPDPLWRHDGRPTAGELVRWTDMEGGAKPDHGGTA